MYFKRYIEEIIKLQGDYKCEFITGYDGNDSFYKYAERQRLSTQSYFGWDLVKTLR